MQNSSGAVERNFETLADTTEFAQQRMTTASENLKIAIGDQLNPALEKLYSVGADAFTWATDFVNETRGSSRRSRRQRSGSALSRRE